MSPDPPDAAASPLPPGKPPGPWDRVIGHLLAQCPDPVLILDAAGSLVGGSPAAFAAPGIQMEPLAGRPWQELELASDMARFLASAWPPAPPSGTAVQPNAQESPEARLTPIPVPGADPMYLVQCARPAVSPATLSALQASEKRLGQLLEQAVDGIALSTLQGELLDVNAMVCQITGYDRSELIGGLASRLFSPETLAAFPLRYDLLAAGQNVIIERHLLRKDGTQVPVEMHTKQMPDGTCQTVFRDLTERRAHEAALRDLETSYRELFQNVREAIYIQDLEGRFLEVNQGATEMYGHPREFFLGQGPEIIAAPGLNDLEALGRHLEQVAQGHPQCFEFWGQRASGEIFPKEVRVYPGTYRGQRALIALAQDISERKQAEKALLSSERHYRELLERLQEGFAFADTEERFVMANPAASAIFGVPEGLQGRSLFEFLDPGTIPLLEAQTAQRRLGQRGHYELPIRRPDGACRLLSLSVSPWVGEDGTYLGSTGVFQDITEQKQAEEALRKSEHNFRSLLEKLVEGFGIVDPTEHWAFANQAAERIFGVPPGELVGRSLREFVDDETYDLIRAQTARRARGETSSYEIAIRRMDGERRVVSLTASPDLDEHGTFVGADGLFIDITDRKRTERALLDAEERYRQLFENTTDAIFWVGVEPDGTFRLESLNPAMEARFGQPAAELQNRPLRECLPEALAEAAETGYRRCLAAGTPIRIEERVETPAGMRIFQTLLVPIRNPQGHVVRIVGFSQDITQGRQAEEALRQTQKLESLGILAGGIAHDFNNLLTAILGNLNLAQTLLPPDAQANHYLENMERAVMKAADLTKQMLAYSGKGRFVVRPHALNHVVREMMDLLKVSISKKVDLQHDLSPDTPLIEADAAQIQQVVMNLVTNASEAIGDQVGFIRVTTHSALLNAQQIQDTLPGQPLVPGLHAVLEISDSGGGISPEIMGRIFDPFFTTKQSGRGLGLSAMLGILKGHHAGLAIASEAGRGTTFTLFFPALLEPPQVFPEPVPEPHQARFRGRVLLAEDEVDVRASTEAMLESLGFDVSATPDGQEALDRFAADPWAFDLVLLDLTMPRLNGMEAYRGMRHLRSDLPVILCSGYSEHVLLQETLAQGFAHFLQKPFQMADLARVLQEVLGER